MFTLKRRTLTPGKTTKSKIVTITFNNENSIHPLWFIRLQKKNNKHSDIMEHKQNSGAALCFVRLMKFLKNDKNCPI